MTVAQSHLSCLPGHHREQGVTSGRFGIHASSDDIQHIAAIAQRDAAQQCEVAEDDRVCADFTSHREVFENLRHGTDPVSGTAEQ